MVDDLPLWESVFADRRNIRVWKRVLRQAGKRAAFELLEPKIRELAKKIRNRQHSACDKSKSSRPTDRKRDILTALDEICESREYDVAAQIANTAGDYLGGVTGVTLYALMAGVCLIDAMIAKRHFERKLFGCLTAIAAIDDSFVDEVGNELQGRTRRHGRSAESSSS